jgi:hypothetical protein
VIVVIGQPVLDATGPTPVPTGSAARVALAAAAQGATVQLIGKVGDDADGEALVLALSRGNVGHVALQREAARRTPRLVATQTEALEPDADDGDETPATAHIEPADPALRPGLDIADVELGLQYLTEFRVIVACDPMDVATTRVVADASGWSAATLIVLVRDGDPEPEGLPATAIVLQAPAVDPEGVFDRLVGELAAAIDDGTDPRTAFERLVAQAGWEPAAG